MDCCKTKNQEEYCEDLKKSKLFNKLSREINAKKSNRTERGLD